jgi:hypothetical protein
MRTDFYVYEHWRPDQNKCFYVGKGYGSRGYCMAGRNWRHARVQNILASLGMRVEVRRVIEGLTGEEAIQREIERIAFYGRRNLVNMTLGGEGPLGRKASARQKRLVSEAMKGIPKTPEVRAKISASLTGRTFGKRDPSVGEKIAAALRGRQKSAQHVANLTAVRNTPEYKSRMAESLRAAHARNPLGFARGHKMPRSKEHAAKIALSRKIGALLKTLRASAGEHHGLC